MKNVGAVCVVAIILSAGCQRAALKTQTSGGTLSGKVLFQGQPLPGGSISFYKDGKLAAGKSLTADGTYLLEGLPLGELTVTVETKSVERMATVGSGFRAPSLPRPDQGDKGKPAKETNPLAGIRYVEIPAKYSQPSTSPLRVTVSEGKQEKEFKLVE